MIVFILEIFMQVHLSNGAIYQSSPSYQTSHNGTGSISFTNLLNEAQSQKETTTTKVAEYQPQSNSSWHGTPGINAQQTKAGATDYSVQKVAQTERAPMAMFAAGNDLIMGTISRNGISKSPVYSYNSTSGLQQRSQLPDDVESANYGFTAEDGLHIVAESWNGMVEYVAQSPDGPWVKHDLTSLNPQDYKNLKWGFGCSSSTTGRQYLGFGNDKHPGVVLSRVNGKWETLTAPNDMLFPTSMGEINAGKNAGTQLICSSTYGETRLHAVNADGTTRKVAEFDGWSYMTVDQVNRIAYVASESGQVYWSNFDDLEKWQPATYLDTNGNTLDSIGRAGEINVHPATGQIILPAADGGRIGNNRPTSEMGTNIYAATVENGAPVFRQIDRIEGAGLWELRTAAVGNDLYLGTGLVGNQEQDAALGGVYRIGSNVKDPLAPLQSAAWMTPAEVTAATTSTPKDAVAVDRIQWVAGGEAAKWPVKTSLDVDFSGSSLIFNHTANWEKTIDVSGKALAGNFWIGTRDENGQWQMCPFEWFRQDQKQCRAGAATESDHLLGGVRPPKSGEEVLLMVSTPARGVQRTDNQRSQIITARWP